MGAGLHELSNPCETRHRAVRRELSAKALRRVADVQQRQVNQAMPTEHPDGRAEASQRARELRVKRLKRRRGISVFVAIGLIALLSPRFALLLVTVAAIIAGNSSIRAWMSSRRVEEARSRRTAAEDQS